jgi:hypothetical protein
MGKLPTISISCSNGTGHCLLTLSIAKRLKKLHHEEGDVESGYILTFGTDSIGSYNGTLHPRPCYDQHWYLFGDGCKAGFAPTEGMIADSDCLEAIDASIPGKEMLCVRFEFNGMTDDRHTLVDTNGKTVWNETASSQQKHEDKFFKTKCLDATKCYRFTLFDATAFPNSSSGAPTHRVTDSFSLSVDGGQFGFVQRHSGRVLHGQMVSVWSMSQWAYKRNDRTR